MNSATQPLVSLRIDGRPVQAPPGAFVLDVARGMGIDIPTLCHHPDLESVGACRLCVVEVTHPEWKGWSGLMTACLYPVKDGIEVYTRSDKVLAARRGILSLLLARCPNSDIIRSLAEQAGARIDGLTTDPNADNCILCGLCTRICETYATGAITTVSHRLPHWRNPRTTNAYGLPGVGALVSDGHLHGEYRRVHRLWFLRRGMSVFCRACGASSGR